MKNVDFKKEIAHLMEEHLSEFALHVTYDRSVRGFHAVLVRITDNRSIGFIARNYAEIYYNLVFFEFGLSYGE